MCMEKIPQKIHSKHEENFKNLNYFDVSLKAEGSFSECYVSDYYRLNYSEGLVLFNSVI